jgi:hypothetical protein
VTHKIAAWEGSFFVMTSSALGQVAIMAGSGRSSEPEPDPGGVAGEVADVSGE